MRWLEHSAQGWEVAAIIIVGISLSWTFLWAYILGVNLLYDLFGRYLPNPTQPRESFEKESAVFANPWEAAAAIVFMAPTEELFFRLPVGLAAHWWHSWWITGAVALFSAMVFTWIHAGRVWGFGNNAGWIKSPPFLVDAVIYTAVFLKCGGWNGSLLIALTAVVIVHIARNTLYALFRRGQQNAPHAPSDGTTMGGA